MLGYLLHQPKPFSHMFSCSTVSGFTEYRCTIYCLLLIKFVVRIKILCFSVHSFLNKNHKRLMSLLCISDLMQVVLFLSLFILCLFVCFNLTLLDSLHHFLVYAYLIFGLTSFGCMRWDAAENVRTHRVEQGPEAVHSL